MDIQTQIIESAQALRGKVIQKMIEMDIRIDIIIGNYFTANEEKHRELTLVVFGSINTSAKIPILEYVLSRDETNEKASMSQLLNNMRKVIEERNVLAHWPVNITEEGQNAFTHHVQLMFVKMKTGKVAGVPELGLQKTFSEDKATLLINCIDSINGVLDQIIGNGRDYG